MKRAAYRAAVAAIRARGDTVPAAALAERLRVLADSMISPPQQAVTLAGATSGSRS